MTPLFPRLLPRVVMFVVFAALGAVAAWSHPSGGPYGPLVHRYTVPAGVREVYYVAPDGDPTAIGGDVARPTALESAIRRAVTGDAIILRGGTYRTGGIVFNQGITFQPYADEEPILKGTRVATQWEAQPNGLWRTSWSTLFPQKPADWWRRPREGRNTPLHRFNNDMVFIDGRLLQSAGWEGELDRDHFYIDYEAGHVYLAADPRGHVVEITAFEVALLRTTGAVHGRDSDRRGPTIRGLTFTQYAYRALEIEGRDPEGVSPESQHGKDVVGTTLEHVTISHCSRVAAYLRGDGLTLRHCRISDTSTEGIYILSSSDVRLERNVFLRNNVERITGYYPAAVKIFNQCHRVTCRDNLVLDQPYSNGIWYDVGNIDAVFADNWVEGALDGFFFEISRGAVCAGNVFVNCDKGVRVLNAADVHVYHNTFVNTRASFERTERSAVGDHFGWHPRTGPDVDQREGHAFVGNLLLADAAYPHELLRFEQPAALRARLTRPQVARLDDNVYVRRDDSGTRPLVVWSPSQDGENLRPLTSPGALAALAPGFETRSRYLNREYGSVVRSVELRNLEPVLPLEVSDAEPLPESVRRVLPELERSGTPGAYPAASASSTARAGVRISGSGEGR